MPVFDVTIPDTSPLLYYAGNWTISTVDVQGTQGSTNGTFHASSNNGDVASFTFNGTAFWIFGSTWFNHGNYTVALNNQMVDHLSGYSDNRTFQVPLSSHPQLPSGRQQVKLTNSGSNDFNWLDVDYVVIQVGDGNASTGTTDRFLDDRATNITYGGQWSDTPSSRTNLGNGYFMGTGSTSTNPGDTASISFHGDAVQVFGATNDQFDVSMDGVTKGSFNVTEATPVTRPSSLLYFDTGFGPGAHVLQLTKRGALGSYLDLDEVQVTSWGSDVASATSSAPATTPSMSSSRTSSPVPIIAGSIVGAVVLIFGLGLGVFFLRRRRRYRGTVERKIAPQGTARPVLDIESPQTATPPSSIAHPMDPPVVAHMLQSNSTSSHVTVMAPLGQHAMHTALSQHPLTEGPPPPEYEELVSPDSSAAGASASRGAPARREAGPLPSKRKR